MASGDLSPSRGVILVGMGGVSSRAEIRPFLRKLFSDPAILPLPQPGRALLSRLISMVRAPKVAREYREIGFSPFREITRRQATALAEATGLPVEVGMQYSEPSVMDGMAALAGRGVKEVLVIPLYPQFSYTTTASALRMSREAASTLGLALREVEEWSTMDGLVSAWVDRISPCLDDEPFLLFSAHSIPARWVARGDPYPKQVMSTVRAVVKRLGNPKHTLAYQSAVGPVEWLGPSVDEALRVLRDRGVARVLVVPISFICEHFETLYELRVTYARLAEELGFSGYRVVDALNDHPLLIAGWKSLVEDLFGSEQK